MEKDWVVVFETDQIWQAEMAREVLEIDEIKAVVLNKKETAYNITGDIEVCVHKNDLEKSLELLKTFKH